MPRIQSAAAVASEAVAKRVPFSHPRNEYSFSSGDVSSSALAEAKKKARTKEMDKKIKLLQLSKYCS